MAERYLYVESDNGAKALIKDVTGVRSMAHMGGNAEVVEIAPEHYEEAKRAFVTGTLDSVTVKKKYAKQGQQ